MKYILSILLFAVMACTSGTQPPPTTTTTTLPPASTPTPTPVVEVEPSSHKPPAAVSLDGQKMGKCSLLKTGVSLFVAAGTTFGQPGACQAGAAAGQACSATCQLPDKSFLECRAGQNLYDCYGWVSSEDAATHAKTPLAGVGVDLFWWAGCLAGICNPMAGPVYTDKWGYYEFETGWMLDTIRLHAPTGWYGVCYQGKPIEGGGTYVNGSDQLNKPLGPFVQHPVLASSCQNGMGVMNAKLAAAPFDPKAEAIRLYKAQIKNADLNPATK